MGYTVAVEISPSHIFAAYCYCTLNGGNAFGGLRFIAGFHFRM